MSNSFLNLIIIGNGVKTYLMKYNLSALCSAAKRSMIIDLNDKSQLKFNSHEILDFI